MAVAEIALAASVVSTLFGSSSKKKAARASRRAMEARAKITKLENARMRRQQIRESRMAAGTALSQGTAQGGGFGGTFASGTQGRVVGVGSQLTSNLSFLDKSQRLNDIASRQEIRANKYQARAATASSVASLGLNIAGLYI